MSQATAPDFSEQLTIAEANLAQIEAALEAERRALRYTIEGQVGLHHRGIHVRWATGYATDEVCDARVDGVLDFVAENGLPCTHARALDIAKGWAKFPGDNAFLDALNEAIDRDAERSRWGGR